mgnify:FL=1
MELLNLGFMFDFMCVSVGIKCCLNGAYNVALMAVVSLGIVFFGGKRDD